MTIKKPLIISISIAALVTVLATGTFILLNRTPDSVYDTAATRLEDVKAAGINSGQLLGALTSPDLIDEPVLSELQELHASYVKSLESLQNTSTTNQDEKIRSAVSAELAPLRTYGDNIDSTITSIDRYVAIRDACTAFAQKADSLTTIKAFTESSEVCSTLLEYTEPDQSDTFARQYLDNYIAKVKQVVSAHETLIEAKTSQRSILAAQTALTAAENDVKKLRETELTLTPDTNFAESIARIETVISKQKDAYIR